MEGLAPLLEAKGHDLRYDRELFIGALWRDSLMGALLESDAVVVIWTENTYVSQFVPAEVGAARASPRVGVLPVFVGEDIPIPRFIQDLMVERIVDTDSTTLQRLADRLDDSVRGHIEQRDRRKKGRPKVFISHRHKDEEIVRALVDCLEASFVIDQSDIRATSVRPYLLPVGENTSDRLRDEISDAEVVLGILTTDTLASSYVAFELGSAWGQRVWTCPLLARGADQGSIPDPIRDLSPLFLPKEGDCFQLLKDLEGFTSLVKRVEVDVPVLADRVSKLAGAAARQEGTP